MSDQKAPPAGRLTVMGQIDTVENDGKDVQHHPMALLIEFDSPEAIREAIKLGACTFKFGE